MRSVLDVVLAHLTKRLDVHVGPVAPKGRPEAYVIVDPVGGRSDTDALHSDYAIQAWSKTYKGAETLCRECCDAMLELGATPYADPMPLGYDGIYHWWQATFTVHALW